MNARMAVVLVLVVVGVILFVIGAAGTVSLIQVIVGIFLAVVGAIALVAAMNR